MRSSILFWFHFIIMAEIKCVILGDSGVGKTSLIRRYVQKTFDEEERKTYVGDFYTKELVYDEINVSLQIWDTAGDDRY